MMSAFTCILMIFPCNDVCIDMYINVMMSAFTCILMISMYDVCIDMYINDISM